jgi:hypothetical protein
VSQPEIQRQVRQQRADIDALYEHVNQKVDALDVKLDRRFDEISGQLSEVLRQLGVDSRTSGFHVSLKDRLTEHPRSYRPDLVGRWSRTWTPSTTPNGRRRTRVPGRCGARFTSTRCNVSPLVSDVRHIAVPSSRRSFETLVGRHIRDSSTRMTRQGECRTNFVIM